MLPPFIVRKREADLVSKLMVLLRTRVGDKIVALRHEDVRTCGIPDLSTTGFGRTCWWEFKHGTPNFQSTGIQELTMLRLARNGFARYVIWREEADGSEKQTHIVHPKDLKALAGIMTTGFSMDFVVDYMLRLHGSDGD